MRFHRNVARPFTSSERAGLLADRALRETPKLDWTHADDKGFRTCRHPEYGTIGGIATSREGLTAVVIYPIQYSADTKVLSGRWPVTPLGARQAKLAVEAEIAWYLAVVEADRAALAFGEVA